MQSKMIQHLTSSADFVDAVLNHQNVLLDIHASWCQPCKRMKPVLAQLSEQMPHIRFLAVRVEELDPFNMGAIRAEVNAVPTLMFFKNGKRIDTNYGYMEPEALAQWLNEKSA